MRRSKGTPPRSCRLGPRKHARCERITGRIYDRCVTNGVVPRGYAMCYRRLPGQVDDAHWLGHPYDLVDYKRGEAYPGNAGQPYTKFMLMVRDRIREAVVQMNHRDRIYKQFFNPKGREINTKTARIVVKLYHPLGGMWE